MNKLVVFISLSRRLQVSWQPVKQLKSTTQAAQSDRGLAWAADSRPVADHER